MNLKKLAENYPKDFFNYAEKILDSYFGNISVFYKDEQILYANEKMTSSVRMKKDDFLKMSVSEMRSKKLWLRSVSSELKEKGLAFDAYNVTKWGDELFTHIEPIRNENDEIVMSAQFSIPKTMLDKFSAYLREESVELEKYKGISEFLYTRNAPHKIVMSSPLARDVFLTAKYISNMDSTVLISGETGTGKDVLANYIYANSTRVDKPFIPINCSAIPSELMESEFFGYDKGAFTGAKNNGKPGFFEIADGGTLFLDEIGELPLPIQAKFLRVLETGAFMRVGGIEQIKTDVRIIAATNRELNQLVKEGHFREDLYYRLNLIPLHLPPLKDRKEDIIELAELFLSNANKKYHTNRQLTQEMQHTLFEYDWPGNIRELRNVIERYCISNLWYISAPAYQQPKPSYVERPAEDLFTVPLLQARDEFEKKYIKAALEATGGSVTMAAEKLGIHRSLLYKKMVKFGIKAR